MKISLVFLVIGFSIISISNVSADGNDLLRECSKVETAKDDVTLDFEDGLALGQCLGMMQGITNLNTIYELALQKNALFCNPEQGITNGEAAKIVVKYLNNNPQKFHEPKIELAIQAFREAFPCK
jgi:hypothetical protein